MLFKKEMKKCCSTLMANGIDYFPKPLLNNDTFLYISPPKHAVVDMAPTTETWNDFTVCSILYNQHLLRTLKKKEGYVIKPKIQTMCQISTLLSPLLLLPSNWFQRELSAWLGAIVQTGTVLKYGKCLCIFKLTSCLIFQSSRGNLLRIEVLVTRTTIPLPKMSAVCYLPPATLSYISELSDVIMTHVSLMGTNVVQQGKRNIPCIQVKLNSM